MGKKNRGLISTTYIRNILFASPFYFLSIVPYLKLAKALDIEINLSYALLGALGWWLALLLRLPFILYAKSKMLDNKHSNKLIVSVSGPAEESIRLIILLIIGVVTRNAYSVGLGWGGIEIIYGLIHITGIGVLQQKNDPKAQEAKALLKQMGLDKSFDPNTPYWGAVERVSANAIHIGFSLILVFTPFMIIVTAPLHSFLNFNVLRMNKKSIRNSQITFFLISMITLSISILLL